MDIIKKLGIDFSDISKADVTEKIEIPRYSKRLQENGKKDKFYIKIKSLALDYTQDLLEEMQNVKEEEKADELFIQIVAAGMVDPAVSDTEFINWLGLKSISTPYQIIKKFLTKNEIIDIGMEILNITGVGNENKIKIIKN